MMMPRSHATHSFRFCSISPFSTTAISRISISGRFVADERTSIDSIRLIFEIAVIQFELHCAHWFDQTHRKYSSEWVRLSLAAAHRTCNWISKLWPAACRTYHFAIHFNDTRTSYPWDSRRSSKNKIISTSWCCCRSSGGYKWLKF